MQEFVSNSLNNYSHYLTYLAVASIVLIGLSIILIPKIIARIPSNYFACTERPNQTNQFTFNSFVVTCIKNLFGLFLIGAGILMLVLPGQGILTILLGVLIIDFPGKYKFEQLLIRMPTVLKSLNWIRRKQNVPDLYINKRSKLDI